MKTTSIMKRALVLSITAILTLALTTAKANTELPVGTDSTKQNFVIKYVGETEDNLNFTIAYTKQNNNPYTLVVRDENGETLYQQVFTTKNLQKKVVVSPNDDFKKLSISIVDSKGKTNESKDVIISSRLVQDYIVRID
jgi:hypothetical protein